MPSFEAIYVYGAAVGLILGVYLTVRWKSAKRAEAVLAAAAEAGLTEPSSLHPLIDPGTCLGCGACESACPEGEVIGLIGGKAVLIEPTRCIGHGACAKACPTGAISLVFGTQTRGVDIPVVGPDFQTNVPGIYIAGELGGMGLIRNAVEQGRQAMDAIGAGLDRRASDVFDVAIVGAGPAGFSATLAAKSAGLRYLTLEQESLGGAVAHYPRGKLVMTEPAILPIIGKVALKDPSKEALLEFWRAAERKAGIDIKYGERVSAIESVGGDFEIRTESGRFRARRVLLAIGRRGTPRKLGVPGEELTKVVYRMIDPEQYSGRKVLIVGGGDSALEAAAAIAELGNTSVILSYRGDAFARARRLNRERVDALVAANRLRIVLGSEIAEIAPDCVTIGKKSAKMRVPNDDVIVCAGGVLPTDFLRSIGIEVETKFGAA